MGKPGQVQPNEGKGIAAPFLHSLVGYRYDACVTWPFSRNNNGHGHFRHHGVFHRAHRYMCELANGPPPTPDHEAAHSCGNGHEGCVNPRHLSWKTRAENQQDRYVHRRKPHRQAQRKLNKDQVGQIRALAGTTTNTAIAARFGVSRGTIRQILTGEIWGPDSRQDRHFTPDEVRAIRAQHLQRPASELAIEYGASDGAIWRIQAGVTYKHVR